MIKKQKQYQLKGSVFLNPIKIPTIRKNVFLNIVSSSGQTEDAKMALEVYAPGKLYNF